jgi:hypothetical protein
MTMTHDARRIAELQRQVDEERKKRLAAEQKAAGLRSAVVRMQAMIARQRARSSRRRRRSTLRPDRQEHRSSITREPNVAMAETLGE